jgi:hypothetical protein
MLKRNPSSELAELRALDQAFRDQENAKMEVAFDHLPEGRFRIKAALTTATAALVSVLTNATTKIRTVVRATVIQHSKNQSLVDLRPPRWGEYCLWLLPNKIRGPAIGDLEEEFHQVQEGFGRKKARFWYWTQVAYTLAVTIGPFIIRVLKWFAFGWVADLVKRITSG